MLVQGLLFIPMTLPEQIIQLVDQIIYGNIYTDHEVGNAETPMQPQPSQSLREGMLLLHRGGLASFKWVK